MTQYSVQPRDWIFVKGYRFLSFAKPMGKNIGKNVSKSLSGKYSQKLLDHAKQSTTDGLKISSKRVIQKQQRQLMIWLEIKSLTKLGQFKKQSQQNNSKTVINENHRDDKEIPKERLYIFRKREKKILMIWD